MWLGQVDGSGRGEKLLPGVYPLLSPQPYISFRVTEAHRYLVNMCSVSKCVSE